MKNAIVAVVVIAAAVLGYVVSELRHDEKTDVAVPRQSLDDNADRLAKAKKRIAELERQLEDARRKATEAAKRNAIAQERVLPVGGDRISATGEVVVAGSDVDVIGTLKKHLPEEQFAQATNVLQQMRMKLANRAKSRMDFLRSLDVSGLSDADRKNHEKFMEMMAKREAIVAKMKGVFPDADSLREMVELDMKMRPVAKQARSALVRGVASELGYSGDDAEVIRDTLDGIIDCTTPGGVDSMIDAVDGQPGVSVEMKAVPIAL